MELWNYSRGQKKRRLFLTLSPLYCQQKSRMYANKSNWALMTNTKLVIRELLMNRTQWLKMQLTWGDLLRSVPCVTVWHRKIISWILWAGEKSIKVWFPYVPRIIKNIGGHLPDLAWTDEKLLHFWVCHTVTPAFENHVNHLWS